MNEKMNLVCEICGESIVLQGNRGLSKFTNHLKSHQMTSEEYYRVYIDSSEHSCPVCGKATRFLSMLRGYAKTCSKRCALIYAREFNKTAEVKKRIRESVEETMLKRYGARNAMKVEEFKGKAKKTKLERYSDENFNNNEMRKRTCLERYGVDHFSKTKEFKEKTRETKFLRHNDANFTNREKCKNTCLERYGVTSPFATEETKQKIKKTKLERYGDENFTNREKNLATVRERYGVDNVFQVKDVKKRIIERNEERHGVEQYIESSDFKMKAEKTCLERHGVKNPMQCREIRIKAQSKYSCDGVNFDSGPELAFFIFLRDNGVDFEYQPDVSLEFIYDGKTHRYFPDFRVNGELIELKGLQFFERESENVRMINPYDRNQDGLYEAKHKCMIENGVRIITDFTEFMNFVKEKYGDDFLRKCKKINNKNGDFENV